jgi:predicted DCC family thiol-disulfide oxidoreductase YuxK
MKHLVFYDGQCGLCDHAVQFILRHDKQEIFGFAPLQGQTAKEKLIHLPDSVKNLDTVILIENFNTANEKTSVLGHAAFRILWLLRSYWVLIGWISFLPSFLYDWGYRLVARNRHLFFKSDCFLPDPSHQDRFLP